MTTVPRLGSSRETHAASRERAWFDVQDAVRSAESAIRTGDCRGAYRSLTAATAAVTEFKVHAREAGVRDLPPVLDVVGDLRRSFGERCVRERVSPSAGTIGRSRRRRRRPR